MDKKTEALNLALEALEEIALAGMSVAPEMIDSKEAFHARQAWRFIRIAAMALEPVKKALAEQPAPVAEPHKQQSAERGEPVACVNGCQGFFKHPPPNVPMARASKPLTDEQIDSAIAELGLNYFADAANNRAVLRELCRKAAYGTKGDA